MRISHVFSPSRQQNENEVIKEAGMAQRVNKKSRKRAKQMERVKKTLKVRHKIWPVELDSCKCYPLVLSPLPSRAEAEKLQESARIQFLGHPPGAGPSK